MAEIDAKTWRAARQALDRAISRYLNDPNVSHIDLGYRSKDGQLVPELAVRVHVHRKLSGEEFDRFAAAHPDRVIYSQKIGFPVDIIEASYSLQLAIAAVDLANNFQSGNHKPVEPDRGSAINGIKVRDCETGQEMILTAWHVLTDRGQPGSKQSNFSRVVETNLAEKAAAFPCYRSAMSKNMDAAVLPIKNEAFSRDGQIELAPVAGAGIPQLGMAVTKISSGRDRVAGIVTGILGYSIHIYDGKRYLIGPAIHIAPEICDENISMPSDSGAVWLDSTTSRAVGLHFASDAEGRFGLALSLPEVLSALKVEIIPGSVHKQKQRRLNYDVMKVSYKLAQFCFVIIFSITLLKFNFHRSQGMEQQEKKLENIEILLNEVRGIAQIEWERQNAIKKIEIIIDQYNPAMEPELKLKIASEIFDMSKQYRNLDIELICATITHESARTWDTGIVSPANAIGLMQIMPLTGKLLAEEQGIAFQRIEDILVDPITNIRLGCRYLSMLIEAYNVDGGLAAYNGGMRRAERWVRNGRVKGILHEETEFYVPTILKYYEQYQ